MRIFGAILPVLAFLFLLPAAFFHSSYTAHVSSYATRGAPAWNRDNVTADNLYTPTLATKVGDEDTVCRPSQYDGATAGAKILACLEILRSSGGTIDARALHGNQHILTTITMPRAPIKLLLGPATFRCEATPCFDLSSATNSTIQGLGSGTSLTTSRAGYILDVDATSTPQRTEILDLHIRVSGQGTGALRVGRTSQSFSENLFRNDWVIRNVHIGGPGATRVGTVGLNLTQLARLRIDNVTVQDFETGVISATNSENVLSDLRIDFYKTGLQITRVPLHPLGGACSNTYHGLQLHGPTTGTRTGVSIQVDCQNEKFYGVYMEVNTKGYVGKTFIDFTGNGQYSRWYGTFHNYTNGTFLNDMVFGFGAARNVFVGEMSNSGTPPIHMENPTGGGGSTQNVFIGCDSFLTAALANPIANGYAISIGADAGGAATRLNLTRIDKLGVGVTPNFGFQVDGPASRATPTDAVQSMISNSNATNNNYAVQGFGSGGTALNAFVGAQIRDHSSGLTDLVFGSKGSTSATSEKWRILGDHGGLVSQGTTFANLGAPPNGTIQYCSNCIIANPCGSGGTGAFAKRLNDGWVCN